MEPSSSDYSDEEVGVVARGQKLWVRGVRAHTTCADIVRALQDAPEGIPVSFFLYQYISITVTIDVPTIGAKNLF